MTSIKIVVPTLNSHFLLPKLIQSLQFQTWSNWNILFVDGQSNHNHREWLETCCSKEERCNWIDQSNSNKGIFGAMNQGFLKAKQEEWLLFWGSDDWAATPKVFESFIEILSEIKSPYPDLIVCNGRYANRLTETLRRRTSFISTKKNLILSSKTFRKYLFWGSTPPHQATFFGPGAISKLSQYSEEFNLAADLDFFLKLSELKKLKVLNIDLELVHISDAGISGSQTQKRLNEVRLAYMKSFGYIWWFPFVMRYIKKLSSLINYS
tara:strand:- start:5405 stop:6202 length:798 start_codon:yes stop_codon:yes gene_type:complete